MQTSISPATNPTPRRRASDLTADRTARLEKANAVISIIADNGHIFHSNGQRSYFTLFNTATTVYFQDCFGGKIDISRTYTETWANFTEAGMMKSLVRALREYILMGTPVPARHFGPWPLWFSYGDPWGYGPEAMAQIRAAVAELGVMA